MKRFTHILTILVLFLLANKSLAQTTRVLFVFDASNSMKTMYDGKPRIEKAKELFYKFIDSLNHKKNYEFALRMYGNTVKYPPGDCNDSRLMVPFAKNNIQKIKDFVRAVQPTGITPIEHSLTQSASDFPDTKAINTIILITDGIEECGGDPCKAKMALEEKGIILKPCIIGIGLTIEQAKAFDCVGNYFSYEDAGAFSKTLDYVTSQTLNKTTAQVNLLDISSHPIETNVNMTFYNEKTGDVMYNYVHSINANNHPDTIPMNETKQYTIIANTIPPKQIEHVKLNIGTHNIIPIDAPQGSLTIKRGVGIYNNNDKVKCVIRQAGSMKTLHVLDFNSNEKFIVGDYDVEVLTLPRTYLYNLNILQSTLKSVDVEDAGQIKITVPEGGDGCILQETKKGELLWVCNLQNNKIKQDFNLQPGNYRVTYRQKSLKQSIYTIEKPFTIKSNQLISVDLYR
ncbi:MAG TPA: VWA domain-containing protein [Bacteroidia bacterium]|nr:VWA domain-containing protein [Bacteroidia bacterium]